MSSDTFLGYAGKQIGPLAELDTGETGGLKKKGAEKLMESDIERLDELTTLMYAEDRRSLLIVLQGIDASGKNGTTRHLARGINPDSLLVRSFKKPTEPELDHDYLWRVHQVVPPRGQVAIFNRSHYEEVIVTQIFPSILDNQRLPLPVRNNPELFKQRYRQINDFERMLHENGTTIIKFLLHISKDEQLERLTERLENHKKNWKFVDDDISNRQYWDDYLGAFDRMIENTDTKYAPWHIIPADRKWFRNYAIVQIINRTLEQLDMKYPQYSGDYMDGKRILFDKLNRGTDQGSEADEAERTLRRNMIVAMPSDGEASS